MKLLTVLVLAFAVSACSTTGNRGATLSTADIPKPEGINLDSDTMALCMEAPALESGEETKVIEFVEEFHRRYNYCVRANALKFEVINQLFKKNRSEGAK